MMPKQVIAMLILSSSLPVFTFGQDFQSVISGEIGTGYSSNTLLNPYFSEWDRSTQTGFGLASTFGTLFWNKNKNKVEATGGLVFEPFYSSEPAWKGYLASASYIRELSRTLNAGINVGSSLFQSGFKRNIHWIQPYVTWLPNLSTSFSLKAGSNFTDYENFQDSLDFNRRMDSFAMEFESWPTFRWQLKAGLYGNLDKLPAIQNEFITGFSVGHSFLNGTRINAGIRFSNFSSETIIDGGTDQPGGPPVNIPGNETSTTEWNHNRLYRLKLDGSHPLGSNWSLFVSTEYSLYESSVTDNISDAQFSAGFRFSMSPRISFAKNEVEPEWRHHSEESTVTVKYSGDGFLYLTGSFNNWERPGIPLIKKSKNEHALNLDLEPGFYEYKLLLIEAGNEEWMKFSKATHTIQDSFGDVNGIITVE